jgi:glycine cleavage system aminomethyltransferase T
VNIPYRLSPLHQWHLQHGGQFISVAGWECIGSYGDPVAEARAIGDSVGLRDLTPLSKIEVQGKNSTEMLADLFHVQAPDVGDCAIGSTKNERDRIYVVRQTADRYLLIAPPSRRVELYSTMTDGARQRTCAHVTDLTSGYAALHLVGPEATELLKTTGSAKLDAMKAWRLTQSGTARVGSLLLRHEVRGIPAWLLLVSRDYAEYVWGALMMAGRSFGIRPFGSAAARSSEVAEAFDVAAVQ